MRKNTHLREEEVNEHLMEFYEYCKTDSKTNDGHKFEIFLCTYLKKLGFEEVVVTRSLTCSPDGGVDLTARKLHFRELTGSYYESYNIQAKFRDPTKTVNPRDIRALGGVSEVARGIFITTGRVSDKAKHDALFEKNGSQKGKPVIIIDGPTLINSCIEMELDCFVFRPVFSSSGLDQMIESEIEEIKSKLENDKENLSPEKKDMCVSSYSRNMGLSRKISSGDVNSSILIIPQKILSSIPVTTFKIRVAFNDDADYRLVNIDSSRRYIASKVKDLYRSSKVIDSDGVFTEKTAYWSDDGDGKYRVRIY